MKTQIDLRTASDEEINVAVAEHVAGLTWDESNVRFHLFDPVKDANRSIAEAGPNAVLRATRVAPNYARDANEVLPLLEKWPMVEIVRMERPNVGMIWGVKVREGTALGSFVRGAVADTFCRAACIGLLKASGKVEVVK